ncbi:acyl-ACP--UDP-N-acetylglucosamine O-acyltransferase [Elusimicrobiota bacterium]
MSNKSKMTGTIHQTAVIDKSANIADNVQIGPYVVIGENVEIGEGTKIGAYTYIECAQIGKNCRILSHAAIGTPPQDLRFKDEKTLLCLGDNATVRECVTLNRGTTWDGGEGKTIIGKNCFFMAYSHVAHDCVLGDSVILVNSVALAGHVTIGEFAVVGGLAAIHQFVRIGTAAMLGGGSMVERDVPPYCIAQGNRAGVSGLNIVGLRRCRITKSTMSALKEAYKLVFVSELLREEALNKLSASESMSIPEVKHFYDFIKQPGPRGIASPRKAALDN